MKRISILILSAAIVLLAACGKKGGKTGLMVPKDATIVVHINSQSLSSKLSWEEIRQTNWFKEMSKEAEDTTAKQLLADPASSGIDTKSDLVFYMKKQGKGGYMVFHGSLTDAAAFEKMLTEVKKKDGPVEVKKDGDFSYIASDKDGVVMWNKSDFIVIDNADMPNASAFGKRGWDGDKHAFLNDSLRLFGKQALDIKDADNLDTDSRFADMIKDGSDVHMWTNAEAYRGDLGPMASLMKINILFDDNVSATSFNFGNGQIVAKSKVYYNAEMRKLLEKYKPSPVSADVINRIPSSNVAAVLAFNYPPAGLHEFLKVIGVDGMANAALAEMNYSIEEFVKATKGDVVLAVSDIAMVEKADTINYGGGAEPYIHSRTRPDLKVLFATSVNDKAAFEKLVTLAWGMTKDKTEGMPEITYKLENNWFAASNSADQTNAFLAGSSSNKQAFASKITGQPFGMYVDLQKIIGAFGGNAKDSSVREMVDASLKMWQDVVVTGGDFNDKALNYSFEINLGDKSTNSLKQLNQYFDKLSSIEKAKKAKYDEMYMPVDTVPAPPAAR